MPARLTIHFNEKPAKTLVADLDGEYFLGRDPQCDFVLDDARVSRRHARLVLSSDRARVEDLSSKNGLALDGLPVEEAKLPANCWLSVGGLLVQVQTGEAAAAADNDDALRQATLAEHQALAEPGLEISILVERLLTSFVEMSGADRGFLLLAGGPERYDVVASRDLSAAAVTHPEFSGSASTVRSVLSSGEPLIQSDVSESPVTSGQPSIAREGIRALVCVPLLAAGRTIGAVYADSRRPGKSFSELDLEILSALAAHAALTMWASGLRETIESLMRGLPTRVDPDASVRAPLPGFPAFSTTSAEETAGGKP